MALECSTCYGLEAFANLINSETISIITKICIIKKENLGFLQDTVLIRQEVGKLILNTEILIHWLK